MNLILCNKRYNTKMIIKLTDIKMFRSNKAIIIKYYEFKNYNYLNF